MGAMTRDAVRARIIEVGIIPSIRTTSEEDAHFAANTVARAGIPIVEVTMTVPNALVVIAHLARNVPDLLVGGGTIFDVQTARRCVDAGARFITSPGLDRSVVEFALKEGVVAMPGALTPTEVTEARQAGADLIKIFPCAQVGGPTYLHALKAPFPDVHFVAAGGVNQQTVAAFIAAGAAAIGVGNELIPKKSVQHRDAHWITELARRFLSAVHEARSQGKTRDESFDRR
jgi:2-dehydro-3-deoxyphosphogluconate aldolase/(4S)-4-hydroxy-2-oxoglutarate aldolase